ncbi:hypothetical protein [Francisella philomiragia]|uniref:hypothetical protein n=1 Tax=Francisella philomiragia TaxID=28110 RepID=UPI001C9DCDFD|nr:hypothetical protein [Francisella philomiragia]MBY7733864.1 hypothetical protein [Francisella philomiragia]
MKKTIILTLGMAPLLMFSIDSDQQVPLKGSDYITTDVGATYVYVGQSLDNPTKLLSNYKLTVKSCNDEKTKCIYTITVDIDGIKPYESVYEIKDGAVYFGSSKTRDEDGSLRSVDLKLQELFPKHIILNKVDKIDNTDEMSHTTGTSIITDVIPEININGNTYKNCIRMDNNVTQCFNKDHGNTCNHIIDYEIYCKGIGLVTENVNGDTLLLEKIAKK